MATVTWVSEILNVRAGQPTVFGSRVQRCATQDETSNRDCLRDRDVPTNC